LGKRGGLPATLFKSVEGGSLRKLKATPCGQAKRKEPGKINRGTVMEPWTPAKYGTLFEEKEGQQRQKREKLGNT